MKLNLWLYKLERKISRFAIERLMSILTVTMAIVFVADFILAQAGYGVSLYSLLYFDRAKIFSGQVWRIITFIFLYPSSGNILLTLISLYFYWWLGSTIEGYWGKERFNLYYLFGFLGSLIAGFIVGVMTNEYLNLSLFLAFAMMFPNAEVLLFFVLPIKVKWLGIIDGLLLLSSFIFGNYVIRAAIIAAIVNFLLFFGQQLIYNIKKAYWEFKNRRRR